MKIRRRRWTTSDVVVELDGIERGIMIVALTRFAEETGPDRWNLRSHVSAMAKALRAATSNREKIVIHEPTC